MKEYLTKSQKIKATCIVRHGNTVLLMRSAEVADPEHRPRGGYFGIPSFTVPFGEDPRTTLENELEAYLGKVVDTISVLDVRQYMSHNDSTQVFEVLFTAYMITERPVHERFGKILFVEESELDTYMFPQEENFIKKYL